MALVNPGHPAPLLIRDGKVVQQQESGTTLPVGFGGEEPRIREHTLQQGDRVLCYTDGIIEEHDNGGEQFGEERLIRCVNRLGKEPSQGLRADLRRRSHTLKYESGSPCIGHSRPQDRRGRSCPERFASRAPCVGGGREAPGGVAGLSRLRPRPLGSQILRCGGIRR